MDEGYEFQSEDGEGEGKVDPGSLAPIIVSRLHQRKDTVPTHLIQRQPGTYLPPEVDTDDEGRTDYRDEPGSNHATDDEDIRDNSHDIDHHRSLIRMNISRDAYDLGDGDDIDDEHGPDRSRPYRRRRSPIRYAQEPRTRRARFTEEPEYYTSSDDDVPMRSRSRFPRNSGSYDDSRYFTSRRRSTSPSSYTSIDFRSRSFGRRGQGDQVDLNSSSSSSRSSSRGSAFSYNAGPRIFLAGARTNARSLPYSTTYENVEEDGLSITLPLRKTYDSVSTSVTVQGTSLSQEASPWRASKALLPEGSTKLHIVNASEYTSNEPGGGKLNLTCQEGPLKQDSENAVQLRWLHVQQPSLRLKTLEKLVMSCPFIAEDMRLIALETLQKAKENFSCAADSGSYLKPGSIIRVLGRHPRPPLQNPEKTETDPVVFLTSPSLTLQATNPRKTSKSGYPPRPLLETLYGYDVGGDRESSQVVQKLGLAGSDKETLHVGQLWCLLIGSDILITVSDESASEIQGEAISSDTCASGKKDPLVVRLTDERGRKYHFVIERDYNYTDILKYAVAQVSKGCNYSSESANMYQLFDEHQNPLTADKWIELLGRSASELRSINIQIRRQEVDEYQFSRRHGIRHIARTEHGRRPHTRSHRRRSLALSTCNQPTSRHQTRPTTPEATRIGQISNDIPPLTRHQPEVYEVTPFNDGRFRNSIKGINLTADLSTKELSVATESQATHVEEQARSMAQEPPAQDVREATANITAKQVNIDIGPVPFLSWQLRDDEGFRTPEQVEQTLIKILSKVNESISAGVLSRIWSKTFRCTQNDLLLRHSFLSKDSKGTRDIINLPALPGNESHDLSSNQEQVSKETQPLRKGDVEQQCEEAMKQLFSVSRRLFNAYIPEQGSPLIHHVCVRFWGAVDNMFRQLTWSTWQLDGEGTYTIGNFDAMLRDNLTVGNAKWSTCRACNTGHRYRTPTDALNHMHKVHFTKCGETKRSFDDSCCVWLRQEPGDNHPEQVEDSGNFSLLEEFIHQLLPISDLLGELHSLVPSVQTNDSDSRPRLPSNVVRAFEEIMSMYVLRAQRMSLYNRQATDPIILRSMRPKMRELRDKEEEAQSLVLEHLQDAKVDVILLDRTSRDFHSLGVQAVGSEFLALALIANLQNKSILPGSKTSSQGQTDFIDMYQRYSAQLRFQANRRPNKRVFLDINAMVEELDALGDMIETQKTLLEKYLRLFSPRSTRTTTVTRADLYKIEKAFARSQQKDLQDKLEQIDTLRKKSGSLKEQVRQTIEILEEDHGKAIRVFTFVTLLFLPLSFVTSFMGMNTTDIRDTEFSQTIFWATGLPVTAVVIVLALLYAYKGEHIEDFIWNLLDRRRKTGRYRQIDTSEAAMRGFPEPPMGSGERLKPIHIDSAPIAPRGQPKSTSRAWMKEGKPTLLWGRKQRMGSVAKTQPWV